MPFSIARRRSHHVRLARLAAVAACLTLSSTVRGADDPPRADPESRRADLRAGVYAGAEPGVKPEGITALNPDTGQAESTYPILSPGEPSPDGRRLVYSRWGNTVPKAETGIWVYDADGEGSARRIFDRPGEPSWTDHGKAVVIAVNTIEDLWETWPRQRRRDRTRPAAHPRRPAGARRLPRRLLAGGAGRRRPQALGGLTLIHPDGTGRRHLTEGAAWKEVFPIFRFSPDSREIAYVEVRTVDGVRTSRLFLVDIDGNHRRELPVALRECDRDARVVARRVAAGAGTDRAPGVGHRRG